MPRLQPNDPRHLAARDFFRVAGPMILLIGLVFVVTSIASLFTHEGFGPPRYFWMGFVGMPLIFVGGVLSSFGYMGAIARYQANEGLPVATDAFNYAAHQTKDGVRTLAGAVTEGLREGSTDPTAGITCPHCQTTNESDARFCKSCGDKLP